MQNLALAVEVKELQLRLCEFPCCMQTLQHTSGTQPAEPYLAARWRQH